MKDLTIHTLAIIILIGIINSCAFVSNSHEKPNVVIVLTDDQGWGDVGYNGNKLIETPALDSLSEKALVIDRFYVSPVCAPTRASILTGKYHLSTGTSWVTHRKEVMREQEITIAEVLKDNGYSTAYFGKWHNGQQYPHNPNGQGFDSYFGFSSGHWNNYFDTELEYNGSKVSTKGFITDVITDSTVAFIKNSQNPFFAFVAYNTPHTPYQVPDKYFNKYKKKGLNNKTATIYGLCENIDDNVQSIQQALKESGKLDNTIFIYLSDNGPNYVRYNGGYKGRKAQVDEGGIRVPFILNYPNGNFKNRKVKGGFAAHIDLLPTILDLCHISSENLNVDGISFANVLIDKNSNFPERNFYSHQVLNNNSYSGSIRTKDYLLTLYPHDTALYNLTNDPYQMTNILTENKGLYKELLTNFNSWVANVSQQGFEPEPIQIGHTNFPNVEFPAHEAKLGVGVKFAGGMGWANDWVTNWLSSENSMKWPIKIVKPGKYKVLVKYTCKKNDLGARFKVQCQNKGTDFSIAKIHEKQFIESPDRVKRDEVYEVNWARQFAAEFNLNKGDTFLELSFLQNTESQIDIKGLEVIQVFETDDSRAQKLLSGGAVSDNNGGTHKHDLN